MRVTIIDSVPLSFNGGYERFAIDFNDALLQHGHESTVASPTNRIGSISYSALAITRRSFTAASAAGETQLGPRRLRHLLASSDLVYVKNEPHELALALLLKADTPLIVGMHSALGRRPGLAGLRGALYETKLYGRLLRRAQAIHVLQPSRSEWVQTRHGVAPEKVHVIPNGVDCERFQPDDGYSFTQPIRLLFVGRFETYKSVDTVVAAARKLSAQKFPFTLTIVGSGPLQDLVTSAVQECAEVTHVGYRSDTETFYRNHDLLLAPSRMETFALVPLEAMACGLPVVVGNIIESAPFVAGGAQVVDPNSPDQLVTAIKSFAEQLRQPGAEKDLRQAARQYVLDSYDSKLTFEKLSKMVEGFSSTPSAV